MSALFSPITLRNMQIANRIAISPMCQYVADEGKATSWHLIHYGNLAMSGAGVLFIESTAVEPIGRITPGDLGLWDTDTEAALKNVLNAIRQFSKIPVVLQLSHAGRKASSATPWNGGQLIRKEDGGWTTQAPSAVALKEGEDAPIAINSSGLTRIKDAFTAAALRARRLEVDGLELHAAHGYLLHQFLSPISNLRTDEYGGSLENRMRFPLEVFDAVRAVFPAEKPVGIKVSATDWIEGGLDVKQITAFAHELKKRGIDWIDVSSGGISPAQKITVGPNYQVPFAQEIKNATGIPTIAVGLITEAEQAEAVIADGQSDMVALARGMLYNPRWPWHAAAKLGATVSAPPSYWRAAPNSHASLFGETKFGAR